MMHPHTELRLISEDMGFGVFATRLIPAGTVVYAKDALDIEFAPGDPLIRDPAYAETVEKYTYIEPDGTRVLSWDHAKYVNHCCEPSTLTTGYGFEIALRDLRPGDELTDDYAIFNHAHAVPLRRARLPGSAPTTSTAWSRAGTCASARRSRTSSRSTSPWRR